MLRTSFHFDLPPDLIAQHPAVERAASRLLRLDGATGEYQDLVFRDLPSLVEAGDLLLFNDTKVVPARVHGLKDSGGRVELLLERAESEFVALVHARASKGLRAGALVHLPGGVSARMLERHGELFRLQFSREVLSYFEAHGAIPLPPYIDRAAQAEDRDRYQTVYAREPGAVAAPTAGLHFDASMIGALTAQGVRHAFVTLHVGAGTFAPMRAEDISAHVMHRERVSVPAVTADLVNATHAAGRRVIAVGTTVVRSVEAAAANRAREGSGGRRRLEPFEGLTDIFIKPGDTFRIVDALITNFHLPESTLLMLCSAFVGREKLLAAYAHAVRSRYRFFSYGDAMFLTPAVDARELP